MLRINDLRYTLDAHHLQGTPREIRLGRRDLGRLLVVDRALNTVRDSSVRNLPQMLDEGDVVVLNNSKRIPGVLFGRTPVGGKVELRFVDLAEDRTALCRIFPSHDVRPGTKIELKQGVQVVVEATKQTQYGLGRVRRADGGSLREVLISQGKPILGFFYEGSWDVSHLNPYYATEEGSVESPLAGLHFTEDLVNDLRGQGVIVCFVTLHSVGSWLPFLESNVDEHKMWAEWFRVPRDTAELINTARSRGRRVIACGSTSLRALEAASPAAGSLRATEGRTDLYIKPGYRFRSVDGYFTNFHQYQTSLIVLDAAFAGRDLVTSSYEEAKGRGYSFYEFGDAVIYL